MVANTYTILLCHTPNLSTQELSPDSGNTLSDGTDAKGELKVIFSELMEAGEEILPGCCCCSWKSFKEQPKDSPVYLDTN